MLVWLYHLWQLLGCDYKRDLQIKMTNNPNPESLVFSRVVNIQSIWLCTGLMVIIFLLGACRSPEPLSDSELESMLQRYDEQSKQLLQQKNESKERGILKLTVDNPAAPLKQRKVSVDLDNAYLESVIERMQFNYTLGDITKVSGRVTAQFEDLGLEEALAAILAPAQLQATIGKNIVVISRLPQVDLDLEARDDYVFQKRILRYADTRALEPLLSTLLGDFSNDDDDDDDDDDDYDTSTDDSSADSGDSGNSSNPSRTLSYMAIHSENAILVKGPSVDVHNALRLLDAVDTDTGHIMIEAMVLEFSAEQLMQIGTRISGGANNNFSDISIDWASLIGETISFTSILNPDQKRTFSAAISMLLLNNDARIVARPYLAAISGNLAKIEVAEDRYVTTFTENSGEVTLEPVTSGVTMTMTPFLLPEEQIRMDIEVSVSQFVPTLDNVALARSRSDASSTMRIGSGETLIIGGLLAAQSSRAKAGVPGARSIPGLGFLFGEKKSSDVSKRLLIYITPHIWEPGMETPMDSRQEIDRFIESQKAFQSKDR